MFRRSDGHWKRPLAPILRPILPFLPLVAALGLLAGLLEGAGVSLFIPLLAFLLSDPLTSGLPGPIRELAALFNQFEPQTRALLLGSAILAMILIKNAVQVANECLVARIEATTMPCGPLRRDKRSNTVTPPIDRGHLRRNSWTAPAPRQVRARRKSRADASRSLPAATVTPPEPSLDYDVAGGSQVSHIGGLCQSSVSD